MTRLIDIPNYFKEFVESLSKVVSYDSITEDDGIYTVTVCDTYYISVFRKLIVNGELATVQSFVKDTSFTFAFDNATPNLVDSIKIEPFKFFYGTQKMTKEELDMIDSSDKVPFVWFHSVYDEVIDKDQFSIIGQEATIRLFILDDSNFKDWLSLDHHNEVIIPITEYARVLLDELEVKPEVVEDGVGNVSIRKHANFGVYVEKGHVEKIFSGDLSGVQLTFSLSLKKNNKCEC